MWTFPPNAALQANEQSVHKHVHCSPSLRAPMSVLQQKGQTINYREPLSSLHLLSPLLIVSTNMNCGPSSMLVSAAESRGRARNEIVSFPTWGSWMELSSESPPQIDKRPCACVHVCACLQRVVYHFHQILSLKKVRDQWNVKVAVTSHLPFLQIQTNCQGLSLSTLLYV